VVFCRGDPSFRYADTIHQLLKTGGSPFCYRRRRHCEPLSMGRGNPLINRRLLRYARNDSETAIFVGYSPPRDDRR